MREIGGPAEAAARVLESCGVDGASLRTVRWRGTGLLTRRRLAASGPIFAIGDAAGYAEPITGEGMSWAIESGAALADLLASRPAGADGLNRRWRTRQARIRHRQMLCRGTALALRCPPLVRAACAVAGSWPAAGRWTASRIGRPAGEGGA
jgi:2-polyprenyl-6-methoxyphenol hydroxylase-like FAD-dependent oxidoreductase